MKEPTFERSIEKLEKIVQALEEGDLSLDDALAKYEDGVKLARACRQKLEKAKAKIDMLIKDEKGNFLLKEFETKEE